MQKQPNSRFILEFRNYPLPADFPAVALLKGKFVFPKITHSTNYMHFHNCMEVGYYEQGSSILAIESRSFRVSKGDLILVPPFTSHITYHDEVVEEPEVEYLYVDPARLLQDAPGLSNLPLPYFQHNSPDFPCVLTAASFGKTITLFQKILEEMRTRAPYYQEAVRGLMLQFMVELCRAIPETCKTKATTLQTKNVFRLAAAVEYIDSHYMEHIQPQMLADLCFMSVTNFRRLFKSVVGISPLEYIHHIRIQRAQQLLCSTEDSVLDISLHVGFDSPSSFNRHFSEIVGMPPLKYRSYCRSVEKKNYVESQFNNTPSRQIPKPSKTHG